MALEPQVSVGIMHAREIHFTLTGNYSSPRGEVTGPQTVTLVSGGAEWQGNTYRQLTFLPQQGGAFFTLQDVTIGLDFHWERHENQSFSGTLCFQQEGVSLVAVNKLPVEDYLCSVISSEMSATAGLELLRAHAVISRSWLLAQMQHQPVYRKLKPGFVDEPSKLIRWFDHDQHTLYDVCADDHCQRYQGITRASNPNVRKAIDSTRGLILAKDGQICDARFSKCCGGMMEKFSTCWEDRDYSYLQGIPDTEDQTQVPDLTTEAAARAWILSEPEAFCNTREAEVLKQVLNSYDQETPDFYRWKVEYTTRELSALIHRRTGLDYGEILELIPLHRGTSGRIDQLKIVGSLHTRIIGKELEIRHTLSESHLYSSAFIVDKTADTFILRGAGWGHGVGLCQIGAALMASKGYAYDQILTHYYPTASVVQNYE